VTDHEQRQLARILLDSAQIEADEGRGFMVPADILSDLRPAERATVDVARHACGIEDRIWDAEHRRHSVVHEITSGVRPRSRHAR
jgi:hypothetical protein